MRDTRETGDFHKAPGSKTVKNHIENLPVTKKKTEYHPVPYLTILHTWKLGITIDSH